MQDEVVTVRDLERVVCHGVAVDARMKREICTFLFPSYTPSQCMLAPLAIIFKPIKVLNSLKYPFENEATWECDETHLHKFKPKLNASWKRFNLGLPRAWRFWGCNID